MTRFLGTFLCRIGAVVVGLALVPPASAFSSVERVRVYIDQSLMTGATGSVPEWNARVSEILRRISALLCEECNSARGIPGSAGCKVTFENVRVTGFPPQLQEALNGSRRSQLSLDRRGVLLLLGWPLDPDPDLRTIFVVPQIDWCNDEIASAGGCTLKGNRMSIVAAGGDQWDGSEWYRSQTRTWLHEAGHVVRLDDRFAMTDFSYLMYFATSGGTRMEDLECLAYEQ